MLPPYRQREVPLTGAQQGFPTGVFPCLWLDGGHAQKEICILMTSRISLKLGTRLFLTHPDALRHCSNIYDTQGYLESGCDALQVEFAADSADLTDVKLRVKMV